MDERLDFSAVKYSRAGVEGVLRLEKRVSPDGFDGRQLEMFNPIRANEVFEIEIRSGLDPMKVLEHLQFDSREAYDDSDALENEYPIDWLEEFDFYPIYGEVVRLAVLKQSGVTWQIVGLPYQDELVLVFKEPIDHDWPGTRYDAKRILASYSYHSDGPGPVSWDGSGALLDLGDWWIDASGGDSSATTKDTIMPRPEKFGEAFVTWLTSASATATFVLFNEGCKWTNTALRQRFIDALVDLSEADSAIGIGHSLTNDELAEVLAILDAPYSVSGAIKRILTEPENVHAEALVVAVEAAAQEQDISFLMNADGFVATVGKL